ncbi:MAG: Lrp/AsnC ligand binding domain-containing protein, partial [Nitrosopumilaceae archaeon]
MMIAYILLSCDLGSENSVIEQLKAIPSVKEALGIYGAYDILVKVESSSADDQRETVTF